MTCGDGGLKNILKGVFGDGGGDGGDGGFVGDDDDGGDGGWHSLGQQFGKSRWRMEAHLEEGTGGALKLQQTPSWW